MSWSSSTQGTVTRSCRDDVNGARVGDARAGGRPGQARARGPRGDVVRSGGSDDGTYAFDRSATRPQVYSIDTPPPDGVGLAPHRPRVLLHPHRHGRPLPADARARRSSTRWAGTTTGCRPSAGSRTTTASAATRAPLRPRLRAAAGTAEGAAVDLAAQLRRALPAADRRGRAGLRAPLAHARAVGRLVPYLRDRLADRPSGSPSAASSGWPAGASWSSTPRPPSGTSTSARRCRRPSSWTGSARAPTTGSPSRGPTATGAVEIETTRPELLAACVALVAHPDDDALRAALRQRGADTPLFGAGPGRGARARRARQGDRASP